MIYAADPDAQKGHYQSPPPPAPGTVTAAQAARSGHDIRAMAHIFSQKSRPIADAVTLANAERQSQFDATQHQAAVYRASYGHGRESTRPGLSASPRQIAEATPPTIFSSHDGLTQL